MTDGAERVENVAVFQVRHAVDRFLRVGIIAVDRDGKGIQRVKPVTDRDIDAVDQIFVQPGDAASVDADVAQHCEQHHQLLVRPYNSVMRPHDLQRVDCRPVAHDVKGVGTILGHDTALKLVAADQVIHPAILESFTDLGDGKLSGLVASGILAHDAHIKLRVQGKEVCAWVRPADLDREQPHPGNAGHVGRLASQAKHQIHVAQKGVVRQKPGHVDRVRPQKAGRQRHKVKPGHHVQRPGQRRFKIGGKRHSLKLAQTKPVKLDPGQLGGGRNRGRSRDIGELEQKFTFLGQHQFAAFKNFDLVQLDVDPVEKPVDRQRTHHLVGVDAKAVGHVGPGRNPDGKPGVS